MARWGLRLCYERERERERERDVREMFRLRERDPLQQPLGTNPRVQVRAGQSIIKKKKILISIYILLTNYQPR